ncbi:hypothetical protein JRQ81_011944 [Phrynocephalus forsythii]|uniref:Uncharacterized protein n=1 Tax=Phrynocephalus forsythii TaxID=171643 RepID=A0A9Q0X7B7_9SAUR|nr:hypothetical protein JRQ81_011944 [Phrynocephalus forsythii]
MDIFLTARRHTEADESCFGNCSTSAYKCRFSLCDESFLAALPSWCVSCLAVPGRSPPSKLPSHAGLVRTQLFILPDGKRLEQQAAVTHADVTGLESGVFGPLMGTILFKALCQVGLDRLMENTADEKQAVPAARKTAPTPASPALLLRRAPFASCAPAAAPARSPPPPLPPPSAASAALRRDAYPAGLPAPPAPAGRLQHPLGRPAATPADSPPGILRPGCSGGAKKAHRCSPCASRRPLPTRCLALPRETPNWRWPTIAGRSTSPIQISISWVSSPTTPMRTGAGL